MTRNQGSGATGGAREPGPSRPLTYNAAESAHSDLTAARERYEELTGRDLSARSAALLRERGEFDPGNPGHRLVAEAEPLGAAERLELMAIGEVLARYYRHPTMLDHAVQAGASWEQIGAARGASAEQARQDYREWAEGQHNLLSWTDGQFGLSDAEYADALARANAPDPGSPGYTKAYAETHPVLCAHADEGGQGAHWLAPGEKCPRTAAESVDTGLAGIGSPEADDPVPAAPVVAADASQTRHFTEFTRSAVQALLTRDITRRARWARDHNDGRPEPAWSTGERLAVALVLADQATLDAESYTTQEAAQRLAGDLAYYGYPGDVATWLTEIRAALRDPENGEG